MKQWSFSGPDVIVIFNEMAKHYPPGTNFYLYGGGALAVCVHLQETAGEISKGEITRMASDLDFDTDVEMEHHTVQKIDEMVCLAFGMTYNPWPATNTFDHSSYGIVPQDFFQLSPDIIGRPGLRLHIATVPTQLKYKTSDAYYMLGHIRQDPAQFHMDIQDIARLCRLLRIESRAQWRNQCAEIEVSENMHGRGLNEIWRRSSKLLGPEARQPPLRQTKVKSAYVYTV